MGPIGSAGLALSEPDDFIILWMSREIAVYFPGVPWVRSSCRNVVLNKLIAFKDVYFAVIPTDGVIESVRLDHSGPRFHINGFGVSGVGPISFNIVRDVPVPFEEVCFAVAPIDDRVKTVRLD